LDFVSTLQTWILPACLGLGLAASTGLRTFLPLLMLAVAARFELFGIVLREDMAWLGSTAALVTLTIAAVVEIAGDKIPVVDHALSAAGTVVRPVVATIAAGSVFAGVDPVVAGVAGLVVGAPTALAFGAAQGGTRLASTATTGGLGNPVLSLVEDVLAFFTVVVALLAPLLVPLVLGVLAWAMWRTVRAVRRRLGGVATG
jgi:hypothetical protein